jgi:hypothetical protein
VGDKRSALDANFVTDVEDDVGVEAWDPAAVVAPTVVPSDSRNGSVVP